MQADILSTGAFARLCGVRKGTLLFYDQEGLLRPRLVAENGYRCYEASQYFDFELISLLKDAGCTLSEIKQHLRHMDGPEFLALLQEKRAAVKQEREKLRQREGMLQDLADCLAEALDFRYDELTLQDFQEEGLEVMANGAGPEASEAEVAQAWKEYAEYVAGLKEKPRKPFGVIVDLASAEQGESRELFRFSRARKATPKEMLHVRPAGRFAVLAHKGGEDAHKTALAGMLAQLRTRGLRPLGNVYVYDMALCGEDEKGALFFAQKYCVRVGH